jgi:hypothetical protein
MGLRADGDEARPRPWPSFKVIYDGESPGDVIMKPSPQCSSDSCRAKSGAAMESPILAFYGRSASLYVQPSSTILSASCGPGYFVTGAEIDKIDLSGKLQHKMNPISNYFTK